MASGLAADRDDMGSQSVAGNRRHPFRDPRQDPLSDKPYRRMCAEADL